MSPANELGLYNFFQAILANSLVIEGRFIVLKDVGEDMNTTNFGQLVTDALSGIKEQKKWPCALMLPPFESEKGNDKGWSTYRCQLYFLCTYKRTGDGGIKSPDKETNLSLHTYQQDWKDMREVAGNFVKAVRELTRSGQYPIREHNMATEQYRRVSSIGNDKLNGISLQYEIQVWNAINCSPLSDYPNGFAIANIDFNPHPLHKQ